MRLSERVKVKRANLGVKFTVPVLFSDQMDDLMKEIEALGDYATEEAINQARSKFENEHCKLKLTISRLSEVEEAEVNNKALLAVKQERARLEIGPDSAYGEADTQVYHDVFMRERWIRVRRHIESAVEKDDKGDKGEWATLDKLLLDDWLDVITKTSRADVSYVIASYSRQVKADKEKAEADQNFLDRDSSKDS